VKAGAWKRRRKGSADIWTHPKLIRAVVDTRGFGMNPQITYDGKSFRNVDEAKTYALDKEK
jgi:hypothetical protein